MEIKRLLTAIAVAGVAWTAILADVRPPADSGAIQLGSSGAEGADPETPEGGDGIDLGERRGFDAEAFERRLDSLWFQRKTFISNGRLDDARKQEDALKAFCAQQGVRRVEHLAGALVAEARRYHEEGSYDRALEALELAESFDPGRPQIEIGRATIYWHSGRGVFRAAGHLASGLVGGIRRSWAELSFVHQFGVVLVVSVLALLAVFSLFMVGRHQGPLRHAVEEWFAQRGLRTWGPAGGWAVLLLPLLTWILAGWSAFYWLIATFRFMKRGERWATVLLLLLAVAVVPLFSASVAFYGMMTDPAVRTILDSAQGDYAPERIVRLEHLADAHPKDPVYRFLLAGLYKEGGFLEESFRQYKRVLEIDPSRAEAHVNIGNIFFRLGRHLEAVAEYRRAIELSPQSALALYNMYLAQSEGFHFREAEQTLRALQQMDPEFARDQLAQGEAGGATMAVDATVDIGSVWSAALQGRPLREGAGAAGLTALSPLGQIANGVSLSALASLVVCLLLAVYRQPPSSRSCIRCGKAFCQRCRREGQGQEYCSQCLHIFVIGDGLAPETKTRKLYEVERRERLRRRWRSLVGLVLPGSVQLLRGRASAGCALILVWLLALLAFEPKLLWPVENLSGMEFDFGMLHSSSVPAAFDLPPFAFPAVLVALAAWLVGNAWRWGGREA